MRKITVFIVLCIAIFSFGRQLTVFYLNDELYPVSVTYECENEDVVVFLFEKMSNPPEGLTTFVPVDILRAYFIVEKSLVIDLRKSQLAVLDFQMERYFIHQALITLFTNFSGIDSVYFLVDGRKRDVLANYVDIRYGFPRQIWTEWPVGGKE
ncbi:MAG: GerMN domain-containing protein [Thermotogaceae bacterium]|nr:GerMN domain-containing protein [Thermotogaceae bacterium]